MSFVYDKGIELDARDLVVSVTENGTFISGRYSTDVRFWNYSRKYVFFPASEEKARLYWREEKRRYARGV
jgi:hypothetical protein